ncbi:hypothetical protein [uncultured Enterococcus sp.]|uniref:hypothetical protein n=1 Tax=uncultured Enterococcus sp. TaxID=167972 RepID=UPI002AA92E94|nr:hypothetical protein [uncultured Enterococcus sp.]
MTDEANKQTEANKRWQEKNKERAKYLSNRSRARSFIRNQAELDDLEELRTLISEREYMLKDSENKKP